MEKKQATFPTVCHHLGSQWRVCVSAQQRYPNRRVRALSWCPQSGSGERLARTAFFLADPQIKSLVLSLKPLLSGWQGSNSAHLNVSGGSKFQKLSQLYAVNYHYFLRNRIRSLSYPRTIASQGHGDSRMRSQMLSDWCKSNCGFCH